MSTRAGLVPEPGRWRPAQATSASLPGTTNEQAFAPRWDGAAPGTPGRDFATVPIREHPGSAGPDGLSVGAVDDASELEAERVAGAVEDGAVTATATPAGTAVLRHPVLQRQAAGSPAVQTPAPGSAEWQAAVAKAANDKQGKEQLDALMKAALAEAAKQEPLKGMIAKGKAFASTPGGVIAITEVVTMLVTGFVLAKQELPITSYTFDLGTVSEELKGITITPTWKGPANDPTEAGVKVEFAPKGSPLSITQGFKSGSKTPNTVEGGIGIKPGGPLSLTAGIKVADAPSPLGPLDPRRAGALVEGSVGATWTQQGGPLSGAQFSGTGKLDDAGNKSVMLTLTIPLGSVPKPRKRSSEERPQRSAAPGARSGARRVPASVDAVIGEGGAPLPVDVRVDMGRRLGADFSRVRIHAGDAAAASARELDATAYTVDNHIVFGAQRFEPGTGRGRKLLAHELVHVVQQGAGGR